MFKIFVWKVMVEVKARLFELGVSLNQTNWFRAFFERLRFGFELDNKSKLNFVIRENT